MNVTLKYRCYSICIYGILLKSLSVMAQHRQKKPLNWGSGLSTPGMMNGFLSESCDTSSHPCQNGGICEKRTMSAFKQTLQICNCKTATQEDKIFIGRHCEYEVPMNNEKICSRSDISSFCLNGGTCDHLKPDDPFICKCAEGYTGAHCELSDSSSHIEAMGGSCDMKCLNGGKCAFGRLIPTPVSSGDNSSGEVIDNGDDDDGAFYQHCRCPPMFTGNKCQIPADNHQVITKNDTTVRNNADIFVAGSCTSALIGIMVIILVVYSTNARRQRNNTKNVETISTTSESTATTTTPQAPPSNAFLESTQDSSTDNNEKISTAEKDDETSPMEII